MRRIIAALVLIGLTEALLAAPVGIYWTDKGNGTVNTNNTDGTVNFAQLDGSGVTTLVAGLNYPTQVKVFDEQLFWGDRNEEVVYRMQADGSGGLTSINVSPGDPRDVAVTNDYIYLAKTGVDSIARVNRDGSGLVDLVTSGLSFPTGIAVADNFIYWSDSGAGGISRSNLDGSGAFQIISGFPGTHIAGSVVATDEYLYWSTRDIALTRGGDPVPGTIRRANLDGTNLITLVDNLVFPSQVVVTSNHLYWSDIRTSKIQRASLDGTQQIDLITGLTNPIGVAVVTATIPIPASVWLFGSAIGLLGWMRRR